MTNVLIITSILLSVAALWAALVRARASGREAEREASEAGERAGREAAALRARLEAEGERVGRLESRLEALTTSQTMTRRERKAARKLAAESRLAAEGRAPGAEGDGGEAEAETEAGTEDVYALARRLESFFSATTHPRELLTNGTFRRATELVRGTGPENFAVLAHALGQDAVLACIALEAVAGRVNGDRMVFDTVLENINSYYYWPRFFALRALGAHAGERPVLAPLLARLNPTWREHMPLLVLREFVAERVSAGEALTARDLTDEASALGLDGEQWAEVCATLEEVSALLPEGVREKLSQWRGWGETAGFVKEFGRVWEGAGGEEVFVLESVAAHVSEMEAAVRREPARSVLLVGESGVGKTALVRALAARLREDGWLVFEAAPAEVLAGQSYIGQIEERVQSIVRQLAGKRVLWVMPNFHEAM